MFLPIDRLQRECCALDDLLSKTPYCATYLAFFRSIPSEFDCLSWKWEIERYIYIKKIVFMADSMDLLRKKSFLTSSKVVWLILTL